MHSPDKLSILFLGDVIGKPGRQVVVDYLNNLEKKPDLIIANVENAAHGFGLTKDIYTELKTAGIQVFTGGNHTFDRKEIFEFIDESPEIIRPANFPAQTPGKGYCLIETTKTKVGVLNIQGQVFMDNLDSPFAVADKILPELQSQTNVIFVDFHAEATAEKVGMGWYLDGKVSALVGTHTHVQTADERILPGGTAFITDAGPCGPRDGIIGMDKDSVFRRMINHLPSRFEVASGPAKLHGVMIEVDPSSGKANKIERVQYEMATP